MLEDDEVRNIAIRLLTAPTARDRQRRIGASNLSNGCDYCLASNLSGDFRETPMLDRAWGGRVLGTAIHAVLEDRVSAMRSGTIESLRGLHQNAIAEMRMRLGALGTYGDVYSTADLVLPSERHALDWKGTTDPKMALLLDFLAIQRGEPAPYGRVHKVHKRKPLSENAYNEELGKLEYKITGYYGQLQLYGMGLWNEGHPVDRLSNVFVSRDSTMWFDNPAQDGYSDARKLHGVSVLSFDYDAEYASGLWQRGLFIHESLEGGASVDDFKRNEHCFPCSLDARGTSQSAEIPIRQPTTPVVDVTFAAA